MRRSDIYGYANALHQLANIPVCLLDSRGRVVLRAGQECAACGFFSDRLAPPDTCGNVRQAAINRAREIADIYIFTCPLGFCNAVRTVQEEDGVSAVIAGPFLLQEIDTLFIRDLAEHINAPLPALLTAYEYAQTVRVLLPNSANAMGRLINKLFDAADQSDEKRRKASIQQRQIGESIQAFKSFSGGVPAYPLEKEQALIRMIEEGNAHDAGSVLNELLGYALFSTGSDLDSIKGWAAELCALLSRTAGHRRDGGKGFGMDYAFVRSLWDSKSVERLAMLMQEMVEQFCQSVFPDDDVGRRPAVYRAMQYVDLHFAENISLADAARSVYLSPGYLSTLFRKSFNISFNQYLNSVRIDEAKTLLVCGDASVTDIAFAVGYESQSYFSKTFRKMTGVSPSEYKDMNR